MGTPRQELVKMAIARLNLWRGRDQTKLDRFGRPQSLTAHDAVESVVAGEEHVLGGTLLAYYRNASERAITRLMNEVAQGAKNVV